MGAYSSVATPPDGKSPKRYLNPKKYLPQTKSMESWTKLMCLVCGTPHNIYKVPVVKSLKVYTLFTSSQLQVNKPKEFSSYQLSTLLLWWWWWMWTGFRCKNLVLLSQEVMQQEASKQARWDGRFRGFPHQRKAVEPSIEEIFFWKKHRSSFFCTVKRAVKTFVLWVISRIILSCCMGTMITHYTRILMNQLV